MSIHTEPALLARISRPIRAIPPLAPLPTSVRLGAHDLINSDGSDNVANLMRMAHIRAAGELKLCRIAQARGLIAPTSKLTYARELQAALRRCWALARDLWTAHPANQARVKYTVVSAYGRPVEGVRRSAF